MYAKTRMVRCKVPGGRLSAAQAREVATLADELSCRVAHLTTRNGVEFHSVDVTRADYLLDKLEEAGMPSRGGSGGSVRSASVSTPLCPGGERAARFAALIQAHFLGNKQFEGLPKKFKIGVDASYADGRHLIQDAGLVYVGEEGGEALYDVWLAGGLGRQPVKGSPFRARVPESGVTALVEAVVAVYAANAPKGKRLKHVVEEFGFDRVVEEIEKIYARDHGSALPGVAFGDDSEIAEGGQPVNHLRVPVFCGQVHSDTLRAAATVAEAMGSGEVIITAEQDLALPLMEGVTEEEAASALKKAGARPDRYPSLLSRVCPGTDECSKAIAPARAVADTLARALGERAGGLTLAVSGCPNSCAQPQLAEIGVLCTRKVPPAKEGAGRYYSVLSRTRQNELGETVAEMVHEDELADVVQKLAAKLPA